VRNTNGERQRVLRGESRIKKDAREEQRTILIRRPLSSSVDAVVTRLSNEKVISASQMADALLRLHERDYAQGKARGLYVVKESSQIERKPIQEWLDEVDSLYDETKVQKLHGRLVILGLSSLDGDLAKDLSVNGFLKALQEEVKPNVETLLTPKGKTKWPSILSKFQVGNVPTHLDHPTRIDELGRMVLAHNLAERIRVVRAENQNKETSEDEKGAFMVQINGAWGVGKSSFLYFLSDQLTHKDSSQRDQWVIINFNAWKHQRLGNPWWWLMNALFQQGHQQLKATIQWRWRSIIFWWRELVWRLWHTIWSPYLIALVALALLLWIIWLLAFLGILRAPGWLQPALLPDTAKLVSAIIPLFITIWGIILGLSRFFLQGSEQVTKTFMESTRDPLEALKKHFNGMVTYIKQPVAIFIDDLDRCRESYVVELLEGIHTLFSEPLITYVIAADQRWICTSYEKTYGTFIDSVAEAGRPLRYLFLEKLFHLSLTLPAVSEYFQRTYWQRLLQTSQPVSQEESKETRDRVKQEARQRHNEPDLLAYLQSSINKGDPLEEFYAREEIASRLAEPEIAFRTELALKDFAPLLEPNPRAMKRFVNTYGFERAVITMTEKKMVAMEQLARWTIIVLRWPLLAEYLRNHPEMIKQVGKSLQGVVLNSKDLRDLFQNDEVSQVIGNGDTGPALDASAIIICAHLRINKRLA
jgi:hypothetical protein